MPFCIIGTASAQAYRLVLVIIIHHIISGACFDYKSEKGEGEATDRRDEEERWG